MCNGFHYVLMMCIALDNIGILNIWGVDCLGINNRISKSEALNLLQNADLIEERVVLSKIRKNLVSSIKWANKL